jgi:hypothetical protein
MKNIAYIIIILSFVSCSDLLEEQPLSFFSQDVVFSSIGDADRGLLGIYQAFQGQGDQIERNHWSIAVPVDGWGVASTDIQQHQNQRGSFATNSVLPVDPVNLSFWNNNFRIINDANVFMNGIENIQEGTDEEKILLLAEARFLRGFAFMELVQFYGGVPLRLEPVTDIFTQSGAPRATEEETWAQVVEDLSYAADNMSETSELGRANKWVAKGQLAKAYLTMGGYPLGQYANSVAGISNDDLFRLAAENAWDVIGNSGKSLITVSDGEGAFLDYGLQFIPRGENSSESLWEIQYEDGQFGAGWGFRTYNGNNRITTTEVDGQSYEWHGRFGGYYTGSEFAVSFHDEDIRWQWSIVPFIVNANGRVVRQINQGAGSGYARFKFRREVQPSGNFSDPINAIILRLSDMYLVYAEAVNEIGGPSMSINGGMTAYEAINAIRSRAKTPSLDDSYLNTDSPYTNNDLLYNMSLESFSNNISNGRHVYYTGSLQERFRDAVLMERAWELCWERHRWLDLKRHNKLIDINQRQITLSGGTLADLIDPIDKSNYLTFPAIGTIVPFSKNIQEHQIYMPIPEAEIQLNPEITEANQNSGY